MIDGISAGLALDLHPHSTLQANCAFWVVSLVVSAMLPLAATIRRANPKLCLTPDPNCHSNRNPSVFHIFPILNRCRSLDLLGLRDANPGPNHLAQS